MALLNFANTYAEVSNRLSLPAATSGDYVQLVFTKDGHIISHGVDYTPNFSAGVRGLVPGSTGKKTEFIRGNGQWLEITTLDLPMAVSVADAITTNTTNTTLLTTQQIIDYVNNSFVANDAMRYKGTISFAEGVYTTTTSAGSVASFPTKCEVGDTYRIISAGTYAGQKCSSGDLLICIKDGTGSGLNIATYWTAIEANINGEVKHSVNGTSIYTYSSSTNVFNIFAPTTGGVQNQVLLSNGNAAPVWANQNAITAGDIIDSAKRALLTAISQSTTGVVSVTVGGTTLSSAAASGTWGISITGQANRVQYVLSTGAGLSMGLTSGVANTFNGSAARTLSLTPATASTIGGVIVDSGSTNKTISVTPAGSIYLDKQNIVNALGYVPGNQSSSYTTIIGNAAISTTNVTTAIANPYFNLVGVDNGVSAVAGSLRLLGSGKLSVSGTNGNVTFSLGEADASNYGGIKIGYSETGKNYAVKMSAGQAYVTVPWTDTTYGLATASADGLVPKFDALGTGALAAGSWVLSKLANGVYDWFALPSTAFSDTWRDITIGGVSIGKRTLNFIPSGDVYLKADAVADNIEDISFGISWYNLSTDEYETA